MSRRSWKEVLEWAGVDPNYTLPKRERKTRPAPNSERMSGPDEYHSSAQGHLKEAVDNFLDEYRELYPPLLPEEDVPAYTRRAKSPFRVDKRDVTAKNVKVGTSLEVPANLDYTKFKKGSPTNHVVRVTHEPVVVDDRVIVETTMGAYIVPLKYYLIRLRTYENK